MSRFDDVVGAGLRSLIESDPRFALVADGLELANLEPLVGEHDPQVAVLSFAALRGVGDVYRLRGLYPATAILVLADTLRPAELIQLLKFGAAGCLSWYAPAGDIVEAIACAQGGTPPSRREVASVECRPGAFVMLSDRELEVFDLICEGHTNPQIARALHISVETVKSHVKQVLRTLAIKDRYQLAAFAQALGSERAVERHGFVAQPYARKRIQPPWPRWWTIDHRLSGPPSRGYGEGAKGGINFPLSFHSLRSWHDRVTVRQFGH